MGLIMFNEPIGISSTLACQISFMITAVWWLVFTIPMWGKMGAAAASVVSYMVAGGCFLVYYLKSYNIPARDVFLFKPEEIARLKGMLGKVRRKLGAKA